MNGWMSFVLLVFLLLSHSSTSFRIQSRSSIMPSKRKNEWIANKKFLKKSAISEMNQHRKEFEKPHPGSYATEDLAKLTDVEDESTLGPRKKVAMLIVRTCFVKWVLLSASFFLLFIPTASCISSMCVGLLWSWVSGYANKWRGKNNRSWNGTSVVSIRVHWQTELWQSSKGESIFVWSMLCSPVSFSARSHV